MTNKDLDRLLEEFTIEFEFHRNENDSQICSLILKPKKEFEYKYTDEGDYQHLTDKIQKALEDSKKVEEYKQCKQFWYEKIQKARAKLDFIDSLLVDFNIQIPLELYLAQSAQLQEKLDKQELDMTYLSDGAAMVDQENLLLKDKLKKIRELLPSLFEFLQVVPQSSLSVRQFHHRVRKTEKEIQAILKESK